MHVKPIKSQHDLSAYSSKPRSTSHNTEFIDPDSPGLKKSKFKLHKITPLQNMEVKPN